MSDTQFLVNGMTIEQLLDFHRARFGDARMEVEGDAGQGSGSTPTEPEAKGEKQEQEQTFTQADVDKVVRERIQRERAKFSDYDDLKAKAGEKATADDRIKDLESKFAATEARALRAEIANAHGISAEDRDLFLTGTDEDTLTAQAERLAARESERKKQGNRVPSEGTNPKPVENDERAAARSLFGSGG